MWAVSLVVAFVISLAGFIWWHERRRRLRELIHHIATCITFDDTALFEQLFRYGIYYPSKQGVAVNVLPDQLLLLLLVPYAQSILYMPLFYGHDTFDYKTWPGLLHQVKTIMKMASDWRNETLFQKAELPNQNHLLSCLKMNGRGHVQGEVVQETITAEFDECCRDNVGMLPAAGTIAGHMSHCLFSLVRLGKLLRLAQMEGVKVDPYSPWLLNARNAVFAYQFWQRCSIQHGVCDKSWDDALFWRLGREGYNDLLLALNTLIPVRSSK